MPVVNNGTLKEYIPDWKDRWAESDNFFAKLTYEPSDGAWTTIQSLNPFLDRSAIMHIDGQLANANDRVKGMVNVTKEVVASHVAGLATKAVIPILGKVASKGGFGSMMEASEAARYAKYWESYAPKQISPGTTRLDWLRVSGRTGRMEISRVIYDKFGRQIYRVDFSDHMRPLNHSIPHLHEYLYGPMSSFGKESLFNFFGK